MPIQPAVAAVILAGGRSERLGGINKALVEIGGVRLIDRVLVAIGGAAPILLATGSNAFDADLPIAPELRVADLPSDYGGPLAGVAAAADFLLARGMTGALLSVAVDTPFFPADFRARALPLLAAAPAVVARYEGQDYPTNALWRLEALRGLPAGVGDGTAPHSLKRLVAALGAAPLDYSGHAGGDPFANLNTPGDRATLEARAALAAEARQA